MGILENILGTKEQNRIAQENLDLQARKGSKMAKFLGGSDQGMYSSDEQPGGLGYAANEQPGGLGKMMDKKPAKQSAEEFNLHKTVKKAAQSEGMKKGGSVSSASKRADGCAIRGKTRA